MQADQDGRVLPPIESEAFIDELQRGLAQNLEVGDLATDGDVSAPAVATKSTSDLGSDSD